MTKSELTGSLSVDESIAAELFLTLSIEQTEELAADSAARVAKMLEMANANAHPVMRMTGISQSLACVDDVATRTSTEGPKGVEMASGEPP